MSPRDVQELQRDLPVLSSRRAPRCRGAPTAPRASSCRRSAAQGRRRARAPPTDGARPAAVRRSPVPVPSPRHGEPRQQKAPLQAAERRRQVERVRGGDAARHVGEDELVLVDIADRHDARQQRRFDPEHVEERIAGKPAGAAGRQEDGGRGRASGSAPNRPSDQPAVLERADGAGRNGADGGMVKTRGFMAWGSGDSVAGRTHDRFCAVVADLRCRGASPPLH